MINQCRVLAVVPARSGSKGVPGKNLCEIQGVSLIGWAGRALSEVKEIDRQIISTDSERFAIEAAKYNLEAPFIRPKELSGDEVRTLPVIRNALNSAESYYGECYDYIIIAEPTSPLRTPGDILKALNLIHETGADSVVTVSPLDGQYHPVKLHTMKDAYIGYFMDGNPSPPPRQELSSLYYRNGLCYVLSRDWLLHGNGLLGASSRAIVTERPVANIDEPWHLQLSEFLMTKRSSSN